MSPSSKPHEKSCLGPLWIITGRRPRLWTEPSPPGEHVVLVPVHSTPRLPHPPFDKTLNPGATRHEPHGRDCFHSLSHTLVFHHMLPYLLSLGCFPSPKCEPFQQKHALVPPAS